MKSLKIAIMHEYLSQEYEGLSISISFSYEKSGLYFVHKVVHQKGKFQYNFHKKINSIFNINKAFSHIKAASLITDRGHFCLCLHSAAPPGELRRIF